MGFTDSSFQSDHDDSKSVSDYIFILNDGAICWKCSKQHTVANNVCKAEYIVASDAAKEAVWLWKFINKLEVAPSIDGPILLYRDSTRALAQVKDPKFHQHTKYILRCYHLIQEIVDEVMLIFRRLMERRT